MMNRQRRLIPYLCSSYLYSNVIQRLAAAWRHSTLMDKLKDNIVLFKPEVQRLPSLPSKVS